MTQKILIIKLGAMGDVLRTTPLLRVLNGEIYWITNEENIPLLPNGYPFLEVIGFKDAEIFLKKHFFDIVLSLDEDYCAALLARIAKKKEIIGVFLDDDGQVKYTETSAEWFDMGLISRFGKDKADALKLVNSKSYQEIIFRMIGKDFNGEEYILNTDGLSIQTKYGTNKIIGIETRAGIRWPMKRWNKYFELAELLKKDGYEIRMFKHRNTIKEYIHDINECDLVVCGDTLAMHIALALKKQCVAIFLCTSPSEIFEYGRLTKIVSPLLGKGFYKRDYMDEVVDAVSLDQVYIKISEILRDYN